MAKKVDETTVRALMFNYSSKQKVLATNLYS